MGHVVCLVAGKPKEKRRKFWGFVVFWINVVGKLIPGGSIVLGSVWWNCLFVYFYWAWACQIMVKSKIQRAIFFSFPWISREIIDGVRVLLVFEDTGLLL